MHRSRLLYQLHASYLVAVCPLLKTIWINKAADCSGILIKNLHGNTLEYDYDIQNVKQKEYSKYLQRCFVAKFIQ